MSFAITREHLPQNWEAFAVALDEPIFATFLDELLQAESLSRVVPVTSSVQNLVSRKIIPMHPHSMQKVVEKRILRFRIHRPSISLELAVGGKLRCSQINCRSFMQE